MLILAAEFTLGESLHPLLLRSMLKVHSLDLALELTALMFRVPKTFSESLDLSHLHLLTCFHLVLAEQVYFVSFVSELIDLLLLFIDELRLEPYLSLESDDFRLKLACGDGVLFRKALMS